MFTPENSVLLVIDVQGKLAQLVHEKEKLFDNINRLIHAARLLDIPILWTEQTPEKIGATIPGIANQLTDQSPIVKWSFSCCGEERFLQMLKELNRKDIIVTGIETHVCVFQTIFDLLKKSYRVQIVGDAVSSRTLENKIRAIDRVKHLGAIETSSEMIICELLKSAKHHKFKEIMSLVKR